MTVFSFSFYIFFLVFLGCCFFLGLFPFVKLYVSQPMLLSCGLDEQIIKYCDVFRLQDLIVQTHTLPYFPASVLLCCGATEL